jgi:hypothetical protein
VDIAASNILGTLPGWLTLAALLFGLWTLSRGGAGSAVSELSQANKVLEKRLHDERREKEGLGGEVRDLRTELAELRGRTDFAAALAAALAPLLEWTAGHEARAQERHEAVMGANQKQLVVLELVAERLGPEPNGTGHEQQAAA